MDIERGLKVEILPVGGETVDCSGVIRWTKTWDWGVGEIVARRLTNNKLKDWESVFVLIVDGRYAGLCILEKKDGWGTDIDSALTPFITAVYIDPGYRGQRLCGKLLEAAAGFARSIGFSAVYLISSSQGLYEKFGFEKCADTVTLSGEAESVYKRIS